MPVHVVDHPLTQHLLGRLRDIETTPEQFRQFTRILSSTLIIEATRGLPTVKKIVRTPIQGAEVDELAQGLAVVPILRAGLAMLEPAVALYPDVAVGYVGLERNETTAIAHSYYCKLPKLTGRHTLCLDPMLATGGSAAQAISLLKAHGADRITFVSVISAPEGIDVVQSTHPDVPIFTGAIDIGLNEKKYIVPGLGDFGDRLYGTL